MATPIVTRSPVRCAFCGGPIPPDRKGAKRYSSAFCSGDCYRAVPAGERAARRFWAMAEKSPDPDGCWIWLGELDEWRYGLFFNGRRRERAHRWLWVCENGPIPAGKILCHNCPGGDNPACVNPAHLWPGTDAENMLDSARKGRHRLQRYPNLQDGERNPCAKLTGEAVLRARERYAAGGIPMQELAVELGVCVGNVELFLKGATWKHVGGPLVVTDQRKQALRWRRK